MLKTLTLLSSLCLSSLIADNTITIRATIAAHAKTQMKTTHVNSNTIRQDIYLKNNHSGLTIALSDSFYGTPLINYAPLSTTPMNFSDEINHKYTKVGELIISQKENQGYLGVTISAK